MPSLIDAREAFLLIKRFHDEQVERDADMAAAGMMPDMVDSLLCVAQMSVLGWFIGGTFNDCNHIENAEMFKETLKRLRERYSNSGVKS